MKLSIETYIPRERFGDSAAAELIAKAGFDALDYSFYWTKDDTDMLGDDYLDRAKALRAHLDSLGIVCNQTHTPFDLRSDDPFELSNPRYLRLIRSLEASAVLGADHAIVHRVCAPAGTDPTAYNLAFYRGLIPYCERFGVHIAVENLFTGNPNDAVFDTPAKLTDVVTKIGSPWCAACVDLGHASITGNEPQDFVAAMDASILRALHVQDNDYQSDRHWLPYMGKIDWDAVAKALAGIGYEGDLTLEVFAWQNKQPPELAAETLRYAERIGRHLISLIEKYL